MSVPIDIVDNFEMANLGFDLTGQQGVPGGGLAQTDPFVYSVNGQGQTTPYSLATATALKIWDSAINVPASFQFLFFVADQNTYLQFITAAVNFTVLAIAGIPFKLSSMNILAAANTTPMAGSAPAVAAIAKIYIQQNSGSTSNGQFTVIN